ncbi:MAG: IS3 family transposase, partial [Acetobacteraceae bacterium]|nr:IS3 family transposase [Acetobacteraceae bacterium]
GLQRVSLRPAERLATARIGPSVGSVGGSCDNAYAGTIHGQVKAEMIRRRGPSRTTETEGFATLEWVGWSNHRRPLEPSGNVPPAGAEARRCDQASEVAMAA